MHPASPVGNSDFVRYHMAGAAAKLKYHSLPVLRYDRTAIAISPRFHQSASRIELCHPRSPNAIVMSIERRNCMAGQSPQAARLEFGPVFQSQPIRRNSSDSRQRDLLSPRKISL
jgi:hypothetical protein